MWLDLANAFGLPTIAEGIETLAQLDELRKIGCAQGQGYLWSRPLPADLATVWLAQHRVAPTSNRAASSPHAPEHLTVGSAPCRVLIVDDDSTYRQMLRVIVESEPGIRVVAEAEDGREAIALARHHCRPPAMRVHTLVAAGTRRSPR